MTNKHVAGSLNCDKNKVTGEMIRYKQKCSARQCEDMNKFHIGFVLNFMGLKNFFMIESHL